MSPVSVVVSMKVKRHSLDRFSVKKIEEGANGLTTIHLSQSHRGQLLGFDHSNWGSMREQAVTLAL